MFGVQFVLVETVDYYQTFNIESSLLLEKDIKSKVG